MAAKAVQSWRIEHTNVPEQWTLTIANPGTGKFKLSLRSPLESKDWESGEIACNSSADTMKWALYGFFADWQRAGSDITVTLAMFDAKGLATTVVANATKYVYTVILMRRISGYSFTKATVSPVGDTFTSVVSIVKPSDAGGVASSAPLSGEFLIQCLDDKGVT